MIPPHLIVFRLIDLPADGAVGVAGNLVAALLGAALGWWLAQRSLAARARH